MPGPTVPTEMLEAYEFFLRQLYEASVGVLMAGAVGTGDLTPTQAKTWDQMTSLEREHFNLHASPLVRPLTYGVYCVHGWETP